MSALDEHLKRHRRRIIEREEQTVREILAAYDEIERELKRLFRELQNKILKAQAAGAEISPSWFNREDRLKSLIAQVNRQIAIFGSRVTPIVTREQEAAFLLAVTQTRELVLGVAGDAEAGIGASFSPRVVETAVGMMGNGSPLNSYFTKTLAPAVAEKIKSEVVKAAVTGTGFKTIARRLEAAGDITRSRALSMARTEVLRVGRETTRQIFEDNSDIVSEWEWVAAKSSRTCAACLALDGRRFSVDTPFPQHPNCRCQMIAVINGVTRPKRTIGRDWFARQSDEVKEKTLGVGGLKAYKDGEVTLDDFVGWTNSKEFGRAVYTKPLSRIMSGR